MAEKSRRWARKIGNASDSNEPGHLTLASEAPQEKVAKVLGMCDASLEDVPPPPTSPEQNRARRGKGRGNASQNTVNAGVDKGLKGGRGYSRLASESFAVGVQTAYQRRYSADLERLLARDDLPPTARWLDSHCHLESVLARTWRGGGKPQVMENEPLVGLAELVASWPAQLDGCINVCSFRRPSNPKHPTAAKSTEWRWMEDNLRHFGPDCPYANKLWFTIGIHPHDAGSWDDVADKTVRHFAAHDKCVGIGECGVDFYKHDQRQEGIQLRAFRAQASLAVSLRKALVIHARLVTAANEDMFFRELQQVVPAEHPIHIHCYSDSLRHALDLCANWPNLRIGLTGSITFRDRGKGKGKSGGKGKEDPEKKGEAHCRELVQGIPLERLLIETDGPYMCPEPFRGQTAHPGHVHRIAERIAEWKGVSLGSVMDATRASTAAVYGI